MHTWVRWTVIVAATLVAFHSTWSELVDEVRTGTSGGYVLIVPPMAALIAVGITHRRRRELPIHDRQTDTIVAVLLLAVSVALKALLMPRYATTYQLMHIDVLAAWVFACGACVAMFGLRVTSRYWFAWLVLFLSAPIIYRAILIQLGGSKVAAGVLTLLLACAAVGVATRTSHARGMIVGAITFVLGIVLLWVVTAQWPDAAIGLYQYVPTGAAFLVGAGAYLFRFRGMAPRVLPPNPVKPVQAAHAALYIVPITVVLALVPLPDQRLTPVSAGPPPTGTVTQVVPVGWRQINSVDYDWPSDYFRDPSTLRRQMIRADEVRPDWDALLRPRTVALQTLQVGRVGTFEVYPTETMYNLRDARVSPKDYIDLGREVTAEYFTVVDDDLLLTWSLLSFIWTRGDDAQRVTLLTVDNHEFDAEFPQPVPNSVANIRVLLQILLRGNASVSDTDPEYKDREMLSEIGRAVVEAQWQGR
ncbi:archaeosortase/exosortase family protein [Rhodococcus artemisiae]|uniref:Archaeosortase/exosortase family protein n=1 Tax=Rhodococcus artemisiae TaxID=714159 RepID=A0ABU7L6I6_9NOCA|nr:archaeosortase/exosortase family protein [Rhodococcus artemisiae]MEE2057133.1 archaeosortase/exosortase family protein [Rhodococcus artemisiae]